jgi:hypothetical protein
MTSNVKPTKTKAIKKRVHPYSSLLKEVRSAWKKNPDVVKNMIQDMIEKKGMLLEHPFLMEFVERFLGIHKVQVQKVNYDLWHDILQWAIRQKIQYIVDVSSWFRIQFYQDKYWATPELHLNYLDQRIAVNERSLNMKIGNDDFQVFKVQMIKQLRKGVYPDTSKHDPFWIGRTLALIQHIEFLKAEKRKLLNVDSVTTVKVPVELKRDQQTHSELLNVSIPSGFFKFIQQDLIKEELKSYKVPLPDDHTTPKLYTRAETSEIMQISLPTLDDMTKQGKIKCHRIGDTNMKRYKWKDIQEALVEIESRYTGRGNLRNKSS